MTHFSDMELRALIFNWLVSLHDDEPGSELLSELAELADQCFYTVIEDYWTDEGFRGDVVVVAFNNRQFDILHLEDDKLVPFGAEFKTPPVGPAAQATKPH